MKLSDAIWMGDSLKKGNAMTWLTIDGSCGCALGGALLAAGVKGEEFTLEYYKSRGGYEGFAELSMVRRLWPWLTSDHIMTISSMYCRIQMKHMLLEQLCDYVRSIEPAEPEYEPDYRDEEGLTDERAEIAVHRGKL